MALQARMRQAEVHGQSLKGKSQIWQQLYSTDSNGAGHEPSISKIEMWLEHMAGTDPRGMTRLPSIYLKCTSMIMDTMNFSIDYAPPFTSTLLQASMIQRALQVKSPSLQTPDQVSPTNYDSNKKILHQKLNIRSDVKMTLQYLGTGLSITSEIINPKDELSMFQQICGGESICVFKGYLSPGDMFQIISRRHYGFPFSSSIYINGLIAARISWCCEYRHQVGFQQGRRGCFRITQLNGGRPCYRCVEFHKKQQTRPGRKQSSGSTCGGSVTNKENANHKEAKPATMESNTRAPHNLYPAPPKPKVMRRKAPPRMQGSDSEQENKVQERNQRCPKPRRKGSRTSYKTLSLQNDKSTVDQRGSKGGDPSEKTRTPVHKTAGAAHRSTKNKGTTDCKDLEAANTEQAQHSDSSSCHMEEQPKDAVQAIHSRLVTAVSEWSAHSEVELSDSSDSSDNSSSVTVPALQQQVAAECHEWISEVTAEDEGLVCQIVDLITVLQESEEVVQLVLRNTGMTDALLHRLAPAISASKSQVNSINLNLNEISPEGARTIICLLRDKPSVKSLLLYGNHLGAAGIKTIMAGLSDLWFPARGTPRVSSFHRTGFQLSELDLGGNQVDSEALRSIAAFLKLNPPLRQLCLAQSPVADMGSWAQLFDAIKVNTNLTQLLLDDNGLGDPGAKQVAEVIQTNQSLLSLELDGNDIGEEGGRAIMESLMSSGASGTLTNISLENNPISAGTIAAINRSLMSQVS